MAAVTARASDSQPICHHHHHHHHHYPHQRVLATDNGGYSALLRLLEGEEEEVQREVLVTLTSVMEGNPDLLEAQGVEAMWRLASSPALAPHLLDWMLVTLVRHEGNRQAVMARPGLVGHTAALLEEAGDTEVTLRVCRLWVQLVQDDDVRVPFGKAHDHARELVETHGALTLLTKALAAHQEEGRVAGPCLLALASLALRDEYCQQVVDEGGLQVVLDILGQETSEPEVVTRALVLLKVTTPHLTSPTTCCTSHLGPPPYRPGSVRACASQCAEAQA